MRMTRAVVGAAWLVFLVGCGGSSPSSPSPVASTPATTTPAPTPAPTPTPTPAPTPAPSGPATQFGTGQYRVGTDIASGRYFTRATASGCYWERQSGFGGTIAEVIANDFVGFVAPQIIVDIAAGDRGFKTDSGCGTWNQTAKTPPATGTITAGWWLVNAQIQPGRYSTTASANCYWERLRDFSGNISGVISNDFVSGGGQVIVQIASNDVGFHADPECGTWRPVNGLSIGEVTTAAGGRDIETNWQLRRARNQR